MPIAIRCHLPGHSLHVTQRGVDRAACFFCERDCLAYLQWLARYGSDAGCAVHAYVLMRNHVHLLLTPTRADGVSRLLALLGEHNGALWEERYDAQPVHSRQYLLACMRYIELNPVRAGLVARPENYRWSSFGSNALGREDRLVTPHSFYCTLGRSPASRQLAYRALFRDRKFAPVW